MKYGIWILWLILCAAIAGYFARVLFFSEDKSDFLIGEATHGHYQIELACTSCHSESFGGQEVLQQACVGCHADELAEAQDSHPKKKFNDPREAKRLEGLDARYCVSCHTEHQQEQTHAMGLTLPTDYCYHCHKDVLTERESHQDLEFDSCASAGCHNYHDNRALYEDFLVKNGHQSWLSDIAQLPQRNHAHASAANYIKPQTELAVVSAKITEHPSIEQEYLHSSHANAAVECSHCHVNEQQQWLDAPGVGQCQTCHQAEAQGFLASKHGMRLATGALSAMTPELSEKPFHADALAQEQNCSTCHLEHSFDTSTAGVQACLTCHNDEHSQAFLSSPHAALINDDALSANQQVTCATCHLPRVESGKKDADGNPIMTVEHNQNATLRPNEKMIRPVCMSCHSLEFSIDALADPELIRNNFNGQPAQHIPSVDWALKRASH